MSAPAQRLGIALVGLRFGEHVVQWLREAPARDFFEIVAVCDLDSSRARRVAEQSGVPVLSSLDDVLAHPGVNAVGLFTPPQGRAALLRRIIESGRDVITTKPIELDSRATLEVLELAEGLGRTVHLNSPAPLPTGDIRQIMDWATTRDLGRLVSCRAETWASYDEQPDGGWYDNPESCPAAPLLRLGVYLINDLIWLMGPPATVHVTSTRVRTGRPTADNASMTMAYPDGAIASIFASFCAGDAQPYRDALAINFEGGTVYRNAPPYYSQAASQLTLVTPDGGGGFSSETIEVPDRSGLYQWELAWRAMRGESLGGPCITPRQIADGVRVIEAMARSDHSGVPEAIL